MKKKCVIDASILDTEGIVKRLENCQEKVVITSTTRTELEQFQNTAQDYLGKVATIILTIAVKNPEKFESVQIDESVGIPDDCIVNYCAINKEDVYLLTADKVMTLKARSFGVETEYLPKIGNENGIIQSLRIFRKVGNSFFLSDFGMENVSIELISDGKVYTNGIRKINVGDDILIAKKTKNGYINLRDYHIIEEANEENSKIRWSRSICSDCPEEDLEEIPDIYASFIRKML